MLVIATAATVMLAVDAMVAALIKVTRTFESRHAALLAALRKIASERVLTRNGPTGHIAIEPTPAAEVAMIAIKDDADA
jgi:hypothetical protein